MPGSRSRIAQTSRRPVSPAAAARKAAAVERLREALRQAQECRPNGIPVSVQKELRASMQGFRHARRRRSPVQAVIDLPWSSIL